MEPEPSDPGSLTHGANRPQSRQADLPHVAGWRGGGCLRPAGGRTLTGCGSPLSAATTTLHGVIDASVVHLNGAVVSAVDGLRLRRGDVVRTGPNGRAELQTRGRVVYEGSDAAVQMIDGGRADLRHGAVVVDAQHGPGLSMTLAGLQVSTGWGSAVRAERSVTVRLGALAGSVGVDSQTGRHLQITPLSQAIVGGDALPDSTTDSPLRLTDDDGEAHAVPTLVRDDLALNSLAAGIDNTGDSTVRVVTAAWHYGLETLPGGVSRSEQVLPVVIAAAAGGDTQAAYRTAVALRQRGASWGVVAHRLHTTSAAVLAALSVFEKGAATGQVGSVTAALAFLSGGTATGNGNGAGAGANNGSGGGHPAQGPSSSPDPHPTASPSSSPDVVGGTIDKVLSCCRLPCLRRRHCFRCRCRRCRPCRSAVWWAELSAVWCTGLRPCRCRRRHTELFGYRPSGTEFGQAVGRSSHRVARRQYDDDRRRTTGPRQHERCSNCGEHEGHVEQRVVEGEHPTAIVIVDLLLHDRVHADLRSCGCGTDKPCAHQQRGEPKGSPQTSCAAAAAA